MAKNKTQPIAQPQSPNISVNLDSTPILYTDSIFISANDDGVTLDIAQKLGNDQVRIVSRIGMSRTHAKKFVTEAGRLLALTENSKGGKE